MLSSATPYRLYLREVGVFVGAGLLIAAAGCRLTNIQCNWSARFVAYAVLICGSIVLPAIFHDRGNIAWRNASFCLSLSLLVYSFLPLLVLFAARSGAPLQDHQFAILDGSLGMNVPLIAAWASRSPVGQLLNVTYSFLPPMLLAAAILPAITGKELAARTFLLANLYAFLLALPLFALVPAIGPWVSAHSGTVAQLETQRKLETIRAVGPLFYGSQDLGVIACPSFHVIWAIICCSVLSCYRSARWPLRLLAGCIALSTLTTGWHYFVDDLAGLAVAFLSLRLATRARKTTAVVPPENAAATVIEKLCDTA